MGLTDSITFTCTACGHSADFPKAQEGKAIYCPKCQAAQVVRAAGTERFQAERIPTGRIAKAEQVPGTDRVEKPHGMAGTARIEFICGACNHTARISSALSGQPVRCPSCGTVQLAGVAAMRVVRLDALGKLPFTCTACSYQARLNPEYAGKAIRCPKCQGAQVVPRVLRDPSGAHQALPSGAAVVRSDPGTGMVRREGTGQIRREGTGSIRKDAPGTASVRSEPSSALRTPAGGIPIAQPLGMPTPLPGSFATPPGGTTVLPEPQHAASAPQLPLVPIDPEADELDLGDTAVTTKAQPAKGSVVRRSGRMNTPRPAAPPAPAEPTLEPARAVQPEPEPEAAPVPRQPARPTPRPVAAPAPQAEAAAPSPAVGSAASRRGGPPAWLVPVLGVVAAVGVISSVVLTLMTMSTNERVQSLTQKLEAATRDAAAATAESQSLTKRLGESESARTGVEKQRADLATQLETLRRDYEAGRSEIERLKAEAAAAAAAAKPVAKPAGSPAVGGPGGK